jgi:hypothetical protein
MSTEKLIYPFPIPNSFFLPHKVVRTFYAKVVYKVVNNRPVIEEVGLSPKCLTYINDTAGLMNKIDDKLGEEIRKAVSLNSLNTTIAASIAPHI